MHKLQGQLMGRRRL